MGYWPRHPKKELEDLLSEFDEQEWRIDRPGTYYRVRCPCGSHKRMIHLSPSGSNYVRNAQAWLARQECTRSSDGGGS